MYVTTPEEVRALDQLALKRISLDELIEQVGVALFKAMQVSLLGRRQVLILVGSGNNGKDALALARSMSLHSIPFIVFELDREAKTSEASLVKLKSLLEQSDLVVDAIFGTGLNREVSGFSKTVIDVVNQSQREIFSIDVPSGLCALTGNVLGAAIKAHMTFTIETLKVGMLLNLGPKQVGKVKIVGPIFSIEEKAEIWGEFELIRKTEAASLLPKRENSMNKSSFGKLMVMAGNSEMPGASLLSSVAAARAGCGYVYVNEVAKADVRTPPDFIFYSDAEFRKADFEKQKISGIVFGPGMGQSERTRELLLALIKSGFERVVLDADGLTMLASLLKEQKVHATQIPSSWVLTPHAGEMSRLLKALGHDFSAQGIEKERVRAIRLAKQELNCVVLLKGYKTLVAGFNSEREVIRIIASGNRALAKAGTGDVLAGLIASFLAQGLSSLNATSLAAYVHGKMADDWLKEGHQDFTLMASDLLSLIEKAVNKLC